MAIEAFVGSVGGGKSYCSVRRMLSYMARGGRVCTNIELVGYDSDSGDLIADSPPVKYLRSLGWEYQLKQYIFISFDRMVESADWFEQIPAGTSRDKRTLLVIDEATDLFDNLDRDKVRVDSGYRALFRFLRLSRHAHIDVLFICQDLASINSRLRGLITSGWRATNMANFRIPLLRVRFPFDLFLLQQFDRRFEIETRREWLEKEQAVFDCYRSEVFGGSIGVSWDGTVINDGKIEVRKMKPIQKMMLFISLALSCVSLFFAVGSRSGSVQSSALSSVVESEKVDDSIGGVIAVSVPKSDIFKYGSYCYFRSGDVCGVSFDGSSYYLGYDSEYGRLVLCSTLQAVFIGDGGIRTYLRPKRHHEAAAPHHEAAAPLTGSF